MKSCAHRQDFDSRIIGGQFRGRLLQLFAGNVHRHVGHRLRQRVEQIAGLYAAAAAVLNQHRAGADLFAHLRSGFVHNRQFGPGQIVFVENADPLKERRSSLVVEVFARQLFGGCTKSRDNVAEELAVGSKGVRFERWGWWHLSSPSIGAFGGAAGSEFDGQPG